MYIKIDLPDKMKRAEVERLMFMLSLMVNPGGKKKKNGMAVSLYDAPDSWNDKSKVSNKK